MKREDFLKYCKCYKGEHKNPFFEANVPNKSARIAIWGAEKNLQSFLSEEGGQFFRELQETKTPKRTIAEWVALMIGKWAPESLPEALELYFSTDHEYEREIKNIYLS